MNNVHETVKEQIANPVRKANHIRLSKIWTTTQQIKQIQAELANGYSFDVEKLTELVNAMFSFINSVAKPEEDTDKHSEVVIDEIKK